MCISSMSGSREISEEAALSRKQSGRGRPRPKAGVYTSEKSDRQIVPEKLSNKAPSSIIYAQGVVEMVEERCLTEGNLFKSAQVPYTEMEVFFDMENSKGSQKEKSSIWSSGGTHVEQNDLLSGLKRVREAARKDSTIRFTSLFHHITVDLLRESYQR